jgi:hypothetical protein
LENPRTYNLTILIYTLARIEKTIEKTKNLQQIIKIELKPFWSMLFDFNWKFGLFLILVICIPRFVLVLHANETANYGFIGLIMLISAIAPFVFLSKYGRKK